MAKNTTVIVVIAVVGVGFLAFAVLSSSKLPTSTSAAPQSTWSSAFQFGVKAIDGLEKALPSFMKTDDSTPSDADLNKYASSSGFASHDDDT